MNLIIEAGGSKSNLVFLDQGRILSEFTEPALQLSRETLEDFEKKIHRWHEFQPGSMQSVFLFAAGKIDQKKEEAFKEILSRVLGVVHVHIHSDMLAACYAAAGNQAGIVGILGTGSNSCYYDGSSITKNISPGGFILGDEGGATDIGKMVLKDYLRDDIPLDIRKELETEWKISPNLVIQNIYGGSIRDAANFCSGIAPFASSRLNNDYCRGICRGAVDQYVQLIEKGYIGLSNQLYLVGSTAFYLKDLLVESCEKRNIELIKIIQHPVKDLSIFLAGKYHL